MKYLCLAYEAEQDFKSMSREEWLALRQETLDYVAALRERGELLDTQALQSPAHAKVTRVRDGRRSVTDGPFAETKEQIGGYFLIEARDDEHALEIAANWPSARIGRIEVRPIEPELREQGRY
ncbi:MAG TPA: YciI family protein [Alcanivorax sp.]|nr:YciI family protein [Alcanivorax sp.]